MAAEGKARSRRQARRHRKGGGPTGAGRHRSWGRWLLVPLLLGIGYGAFWLWAAQRLEDALDQRLAALARSGFLVTVGNRAMAGFPLAVTVRLSGVDIQARGGTPLLAAAEGMRVSWSPLRPGELSLQLRGVQGRLGLLAAHAAGLGGRIVTDGDGMSVTLQTRGLVALPGRNGRGGIRPERAELTLFIPARPPEADGQETALRLPLAWRMKVVMSDVGVGGSAREAARRGDRFALIAAELAWHGPFALPLDRQRLAAWRDAGGTLELEALKLALGEAALDAAGTISLDERLRPLASFDLALGHPARLINFCVAHGLLSLEEARLISARIAALARKNPDRPVSLPLLMEDGRVLLDTLMIGRLAPVA